MIMIIIIKLYNYNRDYRERVYWTRDTGVLLLSKILMVHLK